MLHGEYDVRLATVEGHIKGIRKMLADDAGCTEVLLQLSAVTASLKKISKEILKGHLNHCVKESIEKGESLLLDEFNNILDKYI